MEEAEHSWDYCYAVGSKLPMSYVAFTWLVGVPFCLFLWAQSILHGLWYGLPTFRKHPSRIVTATLFHVTVFLQMLIFMLSYSFLEMILGMRPDKTYADAEKGMSKHYEPYKHLFKITHKQAPLDDHIQKVINGRKTPRSSVHGVQIARKSLYEAVVREMRTNGMTEDEISRTSFTSVMKTNRYNPLLL